MLGSVAGKKVVELGAGIGRFTGALAATADSVLAVDFMETLIEENKKTHGHRSVPPPPPKQTTSRLEGVMLGGLFDDRREVLMGLDVVDSNQI